MKLRTVGFISLGMIVGLFMVESAQGQSTSVCSQLNYCSRNTEKVNAVYTPLVQAAFVDAGTVLVNTEFQVSGKSYFDGTISTCNGSGTVCIGNLVGVTTNGAIAINQAVPSNTNYALKGDTSGNTFLNASTQIQFDITGTSRGGVNAAGKMFIGANGDGIGQANTGTGVLDFASAATGACSADLTITVTGALTTATVQLGVPNASVPAGSLFFAWVSASDTVKIRHCCLSGTSCDPASGTYRAYTFNP